MKKLLVLSVLIVGLSMLLFGGDDIPKFTPEEKEYIEKLEKIKNENIKISQENAAILAKMLRGTINTEEANERLDTLADRLKEINIQLLELISDPLAISVAQKTAQGLSKSPQDAREGS